MKAWGNGRGYREGMELKQKDGHEVGSSPRSAVLPPFPRLVN